MDSVHVNNTMQEFWTVVPDSGSQWNHASIAPLTRVYMELAGIKPVKSGNKYFKIHPPPGILELLEDENHTPYGPIRFSLNGKKGERRLQFSIHDKIQGELILDEKEKPGLKELSHTNGYKSFEIHGGMKYELNLKYL